MHIFHWIMSSVKCNGPETSSSQFSEKHCTTFDRGKLFTLDKHIKGFLARKHFLNTVAQSPRAS